MKKLVNKATEIPKKVAKDGKVEEYTKYSDLIKIVLNVPPKEGFTTERMRTTLRIFDILDSANGTIELEDSEASFVQREVKDFKWGLMHKDIISFEEDVTGMEKVEKLKKVK